MATTPEEVRESLESFAKSCNENERLKAMIKDWNRVMHIRATDLSADTTLTTLGRERHDNSVGAHRARRHDHPIHGRHSDAGLSTVNSRRTNPTTTGRFASKGREDDIVRLDFVIAMLWD